MVQVTMAHWWRLSLVYTLTPMKEEEGRACAEIAAS
jgi:hypothetical protein